MNLLVGPTPQNMGYTITVNIIPIFIQYQANKINKLGLHVACMQVSYLSMWQLNCVRTLVTQHQMIVTVWCGFVVLVRKPPQGVEQFTALACRAQLSEHIKQGKYFCGG